MEGAAGGAIPGKIPGSVCDPEVPTRQGEINTQLKKRLDQLIYVKKTIYLLCYAAHQVVPGIGGPLGTGVALHGQGHHQEQQQHCHAGQAEKLCAG